MAQPIREPDHQDEADPFRVYLAATIAVCTVGVGAILIDASLSHFMFPSPIGHVAVACAVMPWVWYFQAKNHWLLKKRMGAVEWADGFVHGVARRTPPGERIRWMDD